MTHETSDLSPPKMYITQEELERRQVPLGFRDYCAHLYVELKDCLDPNVYPFPWLCKMERVALSKCQYDDTLRRKRIFKAVAEKQKLEDLQTVE